MKTRFDEAKASHAVNFFEQLLVHTKGSYARERFVLDPFQRDEIIRPLFGSMMFDPELEEWVRLYTLAWLEMARKNGKSEIMAGIALLLTGADDEEGAEAYGVAKDTDQASLVFNVARRMVELSPVLSDAFTIYPTNRRIVYAKTSSFYRVVAADALGNLGQDPHAILFDEVIAQPNGELWDALKTGFGARRQPLMVAATTAGNNPASFAKTEHDFSAKVAQDPTLDPRRFVFMRNLPEDADWQDRKLWSIPNPALGSFLRMQVLEDEAHTAIGNPREERRFRQFRLNQWLAGGTEDWLEPEAWDASAGIVVEEQCKGRHAWGGIVVAHTTDISAIHWAFGDPDGGLSVLWRFFLPEDSLPDLERRTNNLASTWVKAGKLKLTEGDVIDYDAHIQALKADASLWNVAEIAIDPNGAIGLIQLLQKEGHKVIAITPGQAGSAMTDWERLVRGGLYRHGGNPVARWMFNNLQVRDTQGGILKIDRKASLDNVDGMVAAELALRTYLVAAGKSRSRTLVSF